MKKRIAAISAALLLLLQILSAPAAAEKSGPYDYEIKDGEATVTKYDGSDEALEIPDEIDAFPVTAIGDAAFAEANSLKSVKIPGSVKKIADFAFSHCASLESVEIGDGTETVGSYAFDGCASLSSIVISDSVSRVGAFAFRGTAYYEDRDLWEDGVLYIGNCLIKAQGFVSGTYEVRKGTRVLADTAFQDCGSLVGIELPEGIVSLGIATFNRCRGLRGITIPDGVTKIGDWCFASCDWFGYVSIPGSVTEIGEQAFLNCTALKNVYFVGTKAQWRKVAVLSGNDALAEAGVMCTVQGSLIPGDVNDDEKLNAKDVVAIMKYVIGIMIDQIREEAADYDKNGKVNAKDVVALMKAIIAN